MRGGISALMASILVVLVVASAAPVRAGEGIVVAHSYLVIASRPAASDWPSRIERLEVARGGRVVDVVATGDVLGGSWAPDGSLVAWTSEVSGALFVARRDGSGKRTVVPANALCDRNRCSSVSYDWAPRGHRLVVGGLAGGSRVEVIDAATGRTKNATPRPDGAYSVSRWLPSGLIAYTKEGGNPELYTVVVARRDGSHPRTLSPEFDDRGDFGAVSLSPDGRRLLVITRGGRTEVYSIVDVASGESHRLKTVPGTVPVQWDISGWANNGRIAFTTRSGGRERVMTVGVDGAGPRTLITLNKGEWLYAVLGSPNGQRVALTVATGTRVRLITVGIDGRGVRTLLAAKAKDVGGLRWWRDGDLTIVRGRKLLEGRDKPVSLARIVYATPPGFDSIDSYDRR